VWVVLEVHRSRNAGDGANMFYTEFCYTFFVVLGVLLFSCVLGYCTLFLVEVPT
jgi:hypothetical protein